MKIGPNLQGSGLYFTRSIVFAFRTIALQKKPVRKALTIVVNTVSKGDNCEGRAYDVQNEAVCDTENRNRIYTR